MLHITTDFLRCVPIQQYNSRYLVIIRTDKVLSVCTIEGLTSSLEFFGFCMWRTE